MRVLLFTLILFFAAAGCSKKCECDCLECGPVCKNRCEGDRCYLGQPCCDECDCK